MKAREMWAPKGWERSGVIKVYQAAPEHEDDCATIRVLVQEIPEGGPAWKQGDKVRIRVYGAASVIGPPFWYGESWHVPVTTECDNRMKCYRAKDVLPPETSRLIRVTGPEEDVARDVADIIERYDARAPVRVEVVDDPADGGDR